MGLVFDASVVIAYKPRLLPPSTVWSVVVIQELMAGARDSSELKLWEATAREYERKERLLVPTMEDWLLAGRVLSSLLRGLKSRQHGKTPRLPNEEKQRIIRDVLIARTVKRAGAVLVTDNVKDFKSIQRFCSVRMTTGREFFR